MEARVCPMCAAGWRDRRSWSRRREDPQRAGRRRQDGRAKKPKATRRIPWPGGRAPGQRPDSGQLAPYRWTQPRSAPGARRRVKASVDRPSRDGAQLDKLAAAGDQKRSPRDRPRRSRRQALAAEFLAASAHRRNDRDLRRRGAAPCECDQLRPGSADGRPRFAMRVVFGAICSALDSTVAQIAAGLMRGRRSGSGRGRGKFGRLNPVAQPRATQTSGFGQASTDGVLAPGPRT